MWITFEDQSHLENALVFRKKYSKMKFWTVQIAMPSQITKMHWRFSIYILENDTLLGTHERNAYTYNINFISYNLKLPDQIWIYPAGK